MTAKFSNVFVKSGHFPHFASTFSHYRQNFLSKTKINRKNFAYKTFKNSRYWDKRQMVLVLVLVLRKFQGIGIGIGIEGQVLVLWYWYWYWYWNPCLTLRGIENWNFFRNWELANSGIDPIPCNRNWNWKLYKIRNWNPK